MGGIVDSVNSFFNSTFGKLSDPLGHILFSPVNHFFGSGSRSGPGTGGSQTRSNPLQMATSTTSPRNIVYGTSRVGGTVAFYGLSGANNEYLWFAVALAGHQVQAISNLVIDGNFIPESAFTGNDVTSGIYAGLVSRYKYLGTPTQAADPNLVANFSQWTTAFQGKEIPYIVVRCKRDATAFSSVPQNIQTDVQGKLIYDPRQDSTVTGGSGSQRNNNPATWTWSNNAVLCIRDYLTDVKTRGCQGWPQALMNDVNIIAQANIADQLVTYTVSGVDHTQNNYTIDGVLTTDRTYSDNLSLMLNCINGTLDRVNGQYTPVCGQYNAPGYSIDQTWFSAPPKIQLGAKARDLYNCVRGKYYDALQMYQQLDFYPYTNATYITQDGNQIWRDLDLSLCTDLYRCMRLATLVGQQSRNQQVVQLFLDWRGLSVGLGDAFSLTIPNVCTNKVFVATQTDISFTANGLQVTITALEDSSASHSWSKAQTVTVLIPVNPALAKDLPLAPTGLVATSQADGVKLTWTPPADGIYYYIEIWRSATTAFGAASLIGTIHGDTWPDTDTSVNGTNWNYWIRARSIYGTYSAYTPSTAGAGASATPFPASKQITAGYGNLLDADAAVIHTGGFAYYTGFNTGALGASIHDLGLSVGDVISWGGRVWSTVNDSTNLRFTVQFIDGSNAIISTAYSALISGATSPTVSSVQNVAIPANTVRISFARDYSTLGTGTCKWWNAGLYRGPVYPVFQPAPSIISTDIDIGTNGTMRHRLGLSGSGLQLGDARNGRGVTASGVAQGYYLSGMGISATATTISVAAGTLLMGGSGAGNVSYNASTVTGLSPSTKYYLYYIDPGYQGGTVTLHATTVNTDLAGNPDIVYIGFWTTPASGSGGGGGGGGCLHENMPVGVRRDGHELTVCALDIEVGDEVRARSGEWVPVLEVEHQQHEDWIEVSADVHMNPSISAFVTETQPFYTPDGEMVRARDVKKGDVLHSRNGPATVFHVGASRNGAALKVIIKIPEPHLFFSGEDGFMLHNGNPKP